MINENNAELIVLKKRLNTFRTGKGALVSLPDDLVLDIIKAWERWTGNSKSLTQNLGIKKEQLAFIIKKGKKLLKEGKKTLGPFTPIEVKSSSSNDLGNFGNKTPIILNWDKKTTIRFYHVNDLVEFLKKSA